MKQQPKPRKTDELMRRIREKLQAGDLFDPHVEAAKELAEAAKEQRKKRSTEDEKS